MRFFYYLIPLSDGRWELHSSLEAKPQVHSDKDVAVLAARSKCRRHW